MPYRFLEDTATADIAFEARGRSLQEVFQASGDATLNVMVEDLDSIRPERRREVEVRSEQLDLALFDFLQELIFLKDAEQLLLRAERVEVNEQGGEWRVRAGLRGEALDPSRHQQRVDVKAVTLHRFELKETQDGWRAFVILDI